MADRTRPTIMDVLDRVLDKGIVIDASVRISLAGVDLVGMHAKIVVSSFETYLRLAEDPRAYELGLLLGPAVRADGDGARPARRVDGDRASPPTRRRARPRFEIPPRLAEPRRRARPAFEIPPRLAKPRQVGDPRLPVDRLAALNGGNGDEPAER